MNNLSLKRAEPVPDPNDLWADDILERRLYAPVLTSLVGDSIEPLVVAVNGGWGTGKTFFLNRWRQEFERPLSNDSKPGRAIYFSAWQDDDLEDPLLAIIGQLHRSLHARPLEADEGIKESSQTKAAKVVESANRVLTKLGKHVDNFAEHWSGVRPVEIVKDFSNQMARRVDAYSEAIDARADLKNRLQDVANEVYEESGSPLVFVIDDLDRCKPLFAIATLERVKHLFDVQHVVFILGIDLQQFGKTLKNVYGELDVANYLNRLIDFEFVLPEPTRRCFVEYIWKEYHLDECFKGKEQEQNLETAAEAFKDVFVFLAHRFNMTLRDIERIVREFVAVEKSICFKNARESTLLALLCSLRLREPKVFRSFVDATVPAKDVVTLVLDNFTWQERGVRKHLQEVMLASYKRMDNQDEQRIHNIVLSFLPQPLMEDQSMLRHRGLFEASIMESPVNHSHVVKMQKLLTCFSSEEEDS